MTAPVKVITERMLMTALTTSGAGAALAVDLVWSQAAHVEVQMFIRQRFGDDVEWALSRELLLAGLQASVGDGDVRVQPAPEGGSVHIVLRTGHGMVLSVDDADLRFFLDRTVALTPLDAEVAVPEPDWPGWLPREEAA